MCYFMGKESPEIMAFKWKLRINLRHNFESSASGHLFGHFAVIKINFQRATHDTRLHKGCVSQCLWPFKIPSNGVVIALGLPVI